MTGTHRVGVIFGEGKSADDLILQHLARSKAPRDFIVVTSDKSLGDRARNQGAAVERAYEFAKKLDRSATASPSLPEKPTRETPDQISAWLKAFSRGRE